MEAGRLSLFEIESFVRMVVPYDLTQVGSDSWMTQHDQLERLNLQAHLEAQAGKHDEYVVEQFVSQGKVEVLVHELLVIETWKASVFPLLLSHFSPITSVKAYMVLYHEATLCNLLEVLLYHSSVCEVGGDSMMELGDYCSRKINALNSGAFKAIQNPKEEDFKKQINRTTDETLKQQALDIGFGVAVCTMSLLRFLSDHVNVLPLGVTSRLLHTHDILLSLVPLVESPPWTRRRAGKIEKFSDQRWIEVKPEDNLMMTKLEGQVWLTIYNLIMDKACRKQYQYNTHRKEVLVRLKRFFTEILLDQLPLLRELKRFIEELSIMEPPPPTASSLAIIEQVPEMREAILKDINFTKIAEVQKNTVFSNDESARQRDIARLAKTYNLDNFEDVMAPPTCGECGTSGPSLKRCSRCKMEWYCGRTCQVAAWKKHQKICDIMVKDQAKNGATTKPAATTTTANTKPAAATAAATSTSTTTKSSTTTTTSAKSTTAPSTSTTASKPAPTSTTAESKPTATKPTTTTETTTKPASVPTPQPAKSNVTGAPSTTTPPATTNGKAFASGKIVMLDDSELDQMD